MAGSECCQGISAKCFRYRENGNNNPSLQNRSSDDKSWIKKNLTAVLLLLGPPFQEKKTLLSGSCNKNCST